MQFNEHYNAHYELQLTTHDNLQVWLTSSTLLYSRLSMHYKLWLQLTSSTLFMFKINFTIQIATTTLQIATRTNFLNSYSFKFNNNQLFQCLFYSFFNSLRLQQELGRVSKLGRVSNAHIFHINYIFWKTMYVLIGKLNPSWFVKSRPVNSL